MRPTGIDLICSNRNWKLVRYSSLTVWSCGLSTNEKMRLFKMAGALGFFSDENLSRSANMQTAVTILTDLILSLEFFL